MRTLPLAALLSAVVACGGGGDSTSLDAGVNGTPGTGADGAAGPGPDGAPAGAVQLFRPTPYRQLADSPFMPLGLADFQVEDFEDGEMNLPGAVLNGIGTPSTSLGDAAVDSVDGDDGDATDGDCDGCNAWYTGQLALAFDGTDRGVPTHVGVVVTDCYHGRGVVFEARDAGNFLIAHLDTEEFCDDAGGQSTEEDRFIGIAAPQGVFAVYVTGVLGNIEVNHIQIGWEQ